MKRFKVTGPKAPSTFTEMLKGATLMSTIVAEILSARERGEWVLITPEGSAYTDKDLLTLFAEVPHKYKANK